MVARQEISLSYLEQLFAKLRRGGLVRSVRGPGGGYLLAHDRDDTRIADIILAVDEPIHAVRCTPGTAIGGSGSFASQSYLGGLRSSFELNAMSQVICCPV